MSLLRPELRVVSNSKGVHLVPFVANPLGVDWGCVLVLKNNNIVMAHNFDNAEQKRQTLIYANHIVIDRKDKATKDQVRMIYGMKTHDYFKRYGYKAE